MAESGDDSAKEIVYQHPHAKTFRECIFNMANKGDKKARELIFSNIKSYYFKQFIQEGCDWVKEFVLKNSQKIKYVDLIIDWAKSGDYSSNETALNNFCLAIPIQSSSAEIIKHPYLDYFFNRFNQGDEDKLTINIYNDYFKNGYKYIFDLIIYSENGFYKASHVHKYILMMNDYPNVGGINILPSKGYIDNLPIGRYVLKEIVPSKGYMLDVNKFDIDITESRRDIYIESYERLIYDRLIINKYYGDTEYTKEDGEVFNIYDSKCNDTAQSVLIKLNKLIIFGTEVKL
jgi:hypothetical protein